MKNIFQFLADAFRSGEQPDPIKPYSTDEQRKIEEHGRNIERLRNFQHRYHQLKNRWPAVYPCNVTLPKPSTQTGA